MFVATRQRSASALAGRRLTTRAFSTASSSSRLFASNHSMVLATGAAVGVLASAYYLGSSPLLAVDETKSAPIDKDANWKEKWRARYNDKIKNWSTPEKIFNVFATVRKNGESFMTVEDFCDAILPADHRPPSEKGKIKRIPDFIRFADLDGDELISFGEYSFFTTLLSLPEEHLKVAFQMFDLDGSGAISKQEFRKVLRVLRKESPLGSQQTTHKKEVEKSGIYAHFFGLDGKKELTYTEFENFIKSLHQGVLQLEFDRYDSKGEGKITARAFGMSVIGYVDPKDLPSFLTRVESLDNRKGELSFEDFVNFNRALKKLPEIGLAVKLYAQGGEINKKDFGRAVKAISGIDLKPVQIDVIYHVLDKDGNGKLDHNELVEVMAKRVEKGMAHHRDVGVARFVNCLVTCCSRKAL